MSPFLGPQDHAKYGSEHSRLGRGGKELGTVKGRIVISLFNATQGGSRFYSATEALAEAISSKQSSVRAE
jgi:hypothetical protein